jgi:hypothetical protein
MKNTIFLNGNFGGEGLPDVFPGSFHPETPDGKQVKFLESSLPGSSPVLPEVQKK